jgi:hypothetical protein
MPYVHDMVNFPFDQHTIVVPDVQFVNNWFKTMDKSDLISSPTKKLTDERTPYLPSTEHD